MKRSINVAQIFIMISAFLQAVHHYLIQPMQHFYLFLLLFLVSFMPAYIIDKINNKWTKSVFVLCGIYVTAVSYYFVEVPIVQAVFFFLPVTALLLYSKRLYYVSCAGGFVSYLFIAREPMDEYFTFLSIYVVFCFLLLMVQKMVYKNVKEKEAVQQGVKAFSLAVEAKDVYTQGHSKRVALYCMILAKHGAFKNMDTEELELTALIHDIGKISTPDSILMKNGKLLPEEYETMKKHPVDGMILAKSFGFSEKVLKGILHHHERFDGKGYPLKVTGKDIPLYSRILAVADSFDAMTSNRSYRKAMTPWDAKKEIENQSGLMYDPHVVEVFNRAYYDMLLICEENAPFLGVDLLSRNEASSS